VVIYDLIYIAVNKSPVNTILTNYLKYQKDGWNYAVYWKSGIKTAIAKEAEQEASVKETDVPTVLF
jgi:hypothetical protein